VPAGYLKIRDALISKGMDMADAKSKAAAIWNKHHKDNPVTKDYDEKHMSRFEFGLARTIRPYSPFRHSIPKPKRVPKPAAAVPEADEGGIAALTEKVKDKVKKWNKWHYAGLGGGLAAAGLGTYALAGDREEMEAKLDLLHEMGLAMAVGSSGMLGPKKLVKARVAKRAIEHEASLWPTNRQQFNLEAQKFGVILLGLPSEAEELLAKKLGQNQVRTALPGPVLKYPSSPNPNPNAANDPSLQNVLNSLLNRNKPTPLFPKPLPKRVLQSSNTRGATTANAHDTGSIMSILQNDEEVMKRRRLAGTWRGTS
jgi:hypothetical protein